MGDVVVGVAVGVAAVGVLALVGLLVAAGRTSRLERAAERRDAAARRVTEQWSTTGRLLEDLQRVHVDPVVDRCPSPGCPWSATAFCSDAGCPGPRDDVERVVVEDRGPVDEFAWLDELLADVGVTPDMTPRQAADRIDDVLGAFIGPEPVDLDPLLERIDEALRAAADAAGVEHAGRSVRLLCDRSTGDACSLHNNDTCSPGTACCPTCPARPLLRHDPY